MSRCECGNELLVQNVPVWTDFKIPFTNITLIFGRWQDQELDKCDECFNDDHNEPYRQAYEAGCEDGYYRGLEDATKHS